MGSSLDQPPQSPFPILSQKRQHEVRSGTSDRLFVERSTVERDVTKTTSRMMMKGETTSVPPSSTKLNTRVPSSIDSNTKQQQDATTGSSISSILGGVGGIGGVGTVSDSVGGAMDQLLQAQERLLQLAAKQIAGSSSSKKEDAKTTSKVDEDSMLSKPYAVQRDSSWGHADVLAESSKKVEEKAVAPKKKSSPNSLSACQRQSETKPPHLHQRDSSWGAIDVEEELFTLKSKPPSKPSPTPVDVPKRPVLLETNGRKSRSSYPSLGNHSDQMMKKSATVNHNHQARSSFPPLDDRGDQMIKKSMVVMQNHQTRYPSLGDRGDQTTMKPTVVNHNHQGDEPSSPPRSRTIKPNRCVEYTPPPSSSALAAQRRRQRLQKQNFNDEGRPQSNHQNELPPLETSRPSPLPPSSSSKWTTPRESTNHPEAIIDHLNGSMRSIDIMSPLDDSRTSLGDSRSSFNESRSSIGDSRSSLSESRSSFNDSRSSFTSATSTISQYSTSKSIISDPVASRRQRYLYKTMMHNHRQNPASTPLGVGGGSRVVGLGGTISNSALSPPRHK